MRAGKIDNNQNQIVQALRTIGAAVKIVSETKKFCDLVVGYRGVNVLIECKDGSLVPSRRQLTADEQEFHDTWAGQIGIANTPEEAVMIVVEHAKRCGRL